MWNRGKGSSKMARDQKHEAPGREMSDVVSVIGPGMEIVGDIKCDGTVRVEGRVEGSIKATKSVVIGKGGVISGDIETQDVVIAGTVNGTVVGASRVELQETCKVQGDIRSRRIKLEEGGRVEGRLHMGADAVARPSSTGSGGKRSEVETASSDRAPTFATGGQK